MTDSNTMTLIKLQVVAADALFALWLMTQIKLQVVHNLAEVTIVAVSRISKNFIPDIVDSCLDFWFFLPRYVFSVLIGVGIAILWPQGQRRLSGHRGHRD